MLGPHGTKSLEVDLIANWYLFIDKKSSLTASGNMLLVAFGKIFTPRSCHKKNNNVLAYASLIWPTSAGFLSEGIVI